MNEFGRMITVNNDCESIAGSFGLSDKRSQEIQETVRERFDKGVTEHIPVSGLLEEFWNDKSFTFEEKIVGTFWLGEVLAQWVMFLKTGQT